MTNHVAVAGRRVPSARGFSLVELLVVIAIIALIISIILPALGAVRTQARVVATQTLTKNFNDAAGAFARDNDRAPGYYSPEEMGHPDNINLGMSAMENAMLDLVGGVVIVGGASGVPADPQTQVPFGPSNALRSANATANRVVDIARMGARNADNPTYFQIEPKYFVQQEDGQQIGAAGHVSLSAGDPSIPDVVDAFGTPLLLWVENRNALTRIQDADDFAAIDTGATGQTVSRFYWASNAAFLRADQLGTERRSQVPQGASDREYSLIADPGAAPLSPTKVRDALVGLLGSPAYGPEDIANTAPNSDQFVPQQARGSFVVQSAGPDGYYVGVRDRGSRRLGGDLRYAWNFFLPGGTARHPGENGNPGTSDVLGFFDDITAQGGI